MSEEIERLASEVRSIDDEVAEFEAKAFELSQHKKSLLELHRKAIDEQFAERDAELRKLRVAASERQREAIRRYEIAIAEQAAKNPIVGRRVYEVKHVGFRVEGKLIPSGLKGIVEAFKPGDPHVGGDHSRPSAGRFVVRILKADGTRSKRCIEFHRSFGKDSDGLPHSWQFEDEKKAD